MTLRHMEIFATVCQLESMTLAGKKLYMTQPAISQAIRELETHYHTMLFERLNSKLYQTEAGKKLYEYAVHIIGLFNDANLTIGSTTCGEVIRVGANFTVGITMLHEIVEAFVQRYPDRHVQVTVNNSKIIVQMLRNNELDLALIEEPIGNDFLMTRDFFHDKITIVANQEHPIFLHPLITPELLSKEKLLLREKGTGVRDLFDQLMYQAGYKTLPSWESGSSKALINAAKAKLGIAVLPYHIVKKYIQNQELQEIHVESLAFERDIVITHHKNKRVAVGLEDFIEVCGLYCTSHIDPNLVQ